MVTESKTRATVGSVPRVRIRDENQGQVRRDRRYVLYWMIANRRVSWNFSLQRAVEWCQELQRPLLILEALRVDYPWASDRLHQFIVEGMVDNLRACDKAGVAYYPYLEPKPGAGRGLLHELAKDACVVVTDEFPCFFLPKIVRAAGRQLDCRLEVVDSNGLLPLRAADKAYPLAHSFRRFLQKTLPAHLSDQEFPHENPLKGRGPWRSGDQCLVEKSIVSQWPTADVQELATRSNAWRDFPIDHQVHTTDTRGGSAAANRRLRSFIEHHLSDYGESRNHPDEDAASGLSPYLHFGHLSAHQVFREVANWDEWTRDELAPKPNGSREGWWNADAAVESFWDELITWRELGYNMCWFEPHYDKYESLPDWALETLREHQRDPRPHVYDLPEFEAAQTHDPIWNAAQRQLIREGRIHNYLRMLWGKKILHWTEHPRDALAIMIELNNKYALDGRNPNSYSGIFWVLGRYDRAWGPERPVFGKIRYMTSDSTVRKLKMRKYLAQYGE